MDFRTYLNFAFGLLALEPIELANELGVSRATVKRWLSGELAPAPVMREPVYAALNARLIEESELTTSIAVTSFKCKINAPKIGYRAEHVALTAISDQPAAAAFEQVKIRSNRLVLHGRV